MSLPIPEAKVWQDADEERDYRWLWSVIMLTPNLQVARSICAGRPVLSRQLDAEALRRARRGAPLPDPDTYVRIRAGHLNAVAESGPFEPKASTR